MPLRPLSLHEARVLGTLMEKARTVPDSYPLTLNTVVGGCNQKSSREPLLPMTDGEAQEALDGLKALTLVFESSGGRATRYEHNTERVLGVPGAAAALLGLLMLRGPQTAAELRIHAERWHRFADISSVEAFLDELAERSEAKGGPLVVRLARAPGAREARWAHTLCGPVAPGIDAMHRPTPVDEAPVQAPDRAPAADLADRVARLEAAVADLQARLEERARPGNTASSPQREQE